jgi:hypothetical protein
MRMFFECVAIVVPVNGFVCGFVPLFVTSGSLLGSSYKVFLHCRHVSCIPNVRRDAFSRNLSFSMEGGGAVRAGIQGSRMGTVQSAVVVSGR